MGCCDPGDSKSGRKAEVSENRRCTDVIWLIFFIAYAIVIFALLTYTQVEGADPQKVIRAVDWKGRVCGAKATKANPDNLPDYPYGAWPDPYYAYDFKVCVKSCNATKDWLFTVKYDTISFGDAYCIPNYFVNSTDSDPANSSVVEGQGSTSTLGSTSNTASRAMGDMLTAWPIIFAAAGVALGMSFIWTYVVQKCQKCLVFSLVFAISAAGALAGYVILDDAYNGDSAPLSETFAASSLAAQKAVGWAFVGGTLLFLIIIFALRKQILLALQVISVAADAIQDLPSLILVPVVPFFLGIAYITLWISVCLFIFSVTVPESRSVQELYPPGFTFDAVATIPEPLQTFVRAVAGNDTEFNIAYVDVEMSRMNGVTQPADTMPFFDDYRGNYTELNWNQDLRNAFAVHFFNLLWSLQFIIYMVYLVFAGAVAEWYFSVTDEKGKKIIGKEGDKLSPTPIRDSLWRTVRYHLGSVAFGSFIIAVIQFCRAVVHYLERQSKTQHNRFQKALFCCLKCCLWCIEKCCDAISKNGYVWMAVWGDDFMSSTCGAFDLIWKNLIRFAAINFVGDYLLMIGKVFVSLGTAGITLIMLTAVYGDSLSSLVMPTFMGFVVAYLIASFFMEMFETTIDTIFLCFLIDEKYNAQSMYAPERLKKLIDKHEEESYNQAKRDGHKLATEAYRPGITKEKTQANIPMDQVQTANS